MQFDQLEELVNLVARSGVSEVTIRTEGRRVSIRKPLPYAPQPAAAPVTALTEVGAAQVTAGPFDQDVSEVGRMVTAPMVGIFHHAEPPVGPGATIAVGQVVGIIESMKLMNEVRSDVAGSVSEILVEAGMAVEYGQPLFALSD